MSCLCLAVSGQGGYHLRGGPGPRNLHSRPQLQEGQQLLVALQAVLRIWWHGPQAEPLH